MIGEAGIITKKGEVILDTLFSSLLPFPLELLCFLVSLGITMAAAGWFTRRLETICDRLELSAGVLSILGALGANIPNYVASFDAIAHGSTVVGLGIIIGSNIYNIAIILGIATFVTNDRQGIHFSWEEASQVWYVGGYTLAIMLTTLLAVWLLPQHDFWPVFSHSPLARWVLFLVLFATSGLFAAFAWHILRRPHPVHAEKHLAEPRATRRHSLPSLVVEVIVALVVALGGVVVMVQAGQNLTTELHMVPALAGLLVLAVATSLPNTVVALILVRTGRAAACVEEIFSSNSVNSALGIALPLLFWYQGIHDPLLLLLDAPLMVLLMLMALLGTRRHRLNRHLGLALLLIYGAWVGTHLFL